MAESPLKEHAK